MEHAPFGGSTASRVIGCPGYLREAAKLAPRFHDTAGPAADLGTASHYLGELCLRDGKAVPEDWRGEEMPGQNASWPVNTDMIHAVTIYVDYVRRRQREMGADLYVEATVRPLPEFDDMFGSADAILVEPFGDIEVIDYKNGTGFYVSEIDNDQMNYYALGALYVVGPLDVDKVTTTIVQPRCSNVDGVRPWGTSPAALLDYADVLRAARKESEKPDAPLVPGSYCTFCPVKKAGACEALNSIPGKVVVAEFADIIAAQPDVEPAIVCTAPDPSDPEQMWLARQMVKPLKHWIAGLDELEQINLEHGVPMRGRKLVRKRANRRLRNVAATKAALDAREDTVEDDYMTVRELKSPAQLERSKGITKNWVATQTYTPEGGLTVADESDPRPAVTLLDEFADIIEKVTTNSD